MAACLLRMVAMNPTRGTKQKANTPLITTSLRPQNNFIRGWRSALTDPPEALCKE
jgi:hypothetical protein